MKGVKRKCHHRGILDIYCKIDRSEPWMFTQKLRTNIQLDASSITQCLLSPFCYVIYPGYRPSRYRCFVFSIGSNGNDVKIAVHSNYFYKREKSCYMLEMGTLGVVTSLPKRGYL